MMKTIMMIATLAIVRQIIMKIVYVKTTMQGMELAVQPKIMKKMIIT